MSDEKSEAFNIMYLVVACFVSAALFLTIGNYMGVQRVRLEAVKAGHGKWVADEAGRTTFEWLSEKEKK